MVSSANTYAAFMCGRHCSTLFMLRTYLTLPFYWQLRDRAITQRAPGLRQTACPPPGLKDSRPFLWEFCLAGLWIALTILGIPWLAGQLLCLGSCQALGSVDFQWPPGSGVDSELGVLSSTSPEVAERGGSLGSVLQGRPCLASRNLSTASTGL